MRARTSQNISGFTLIELTVVIVLLGIIASVAVPKFINVSADARTANLNALKAAINDGARQVYAQSYIQGTHKEASSSVVVNGVSVATRYGYPQSVIINALFSVDFVGWLDISALRYPDSNGTTDWLLTDDADSDGVSLGVNNGGDGIGFVLDSYQEDTGAADGISLCGVAYLQAENLGDTPQVTVFNSEC